MEYPSENNLRIVLIKLSKGSKKS